MRGFSMGVIRWGRPRLSFCRSAGYLKICLQFRMPWGIIDKLKFISTKDFMMARTTNSDTLPFVESRYELGMLASQRVRDLNGGAEPVVEKQHDKPTVVALREIASGRVDVDNLRHEFVQSYKNAPVASEDDISFEVKSEDPLLREIEAELENALIEEPVAAAESEEIADVASGDLSAEE
jgi:DNA-directed RNA polymerase subunit omega